VKQAGADEGAGAGDAFDHSGCFHGFGGGLMVDDKSLGFYLTTNFH
jgi:hypothetical protein